MILVETLNLSTGQVVLSEYVPSENDDAQSVVVPSSVSRFQAKAALMDAGLLHYAELVIDDAPDIVKLAWSEATEWRRNSPAISAIGSALGLSESDIDQLFITASTIVA